MKWTLFTLRLPDAGSADVSSAYREKHALPLDLVPKVIFALRAQCGSRDRYGTACGSKRVFDPVTRAYADR